MARSSLGAELRSPADDRVVTLSGHRSPLQRNLAPRCQPL